MKWQPSPTMRPPPTALSCVQWSEGMAPAFTNMMKLFGSATVPSRVFIFTTCGAKRRLNPTIKC